MAIQIFFGIFTPIPGVSWSNLTCAYFSNGLVKNHQLGKVPRPQKTWSEWKIGLDDLIAVSGATRWHHFECFKHMKGAKWMLFEKYLEDWKKGVVFGGLSFYQSDLMWWCQQITCKKLSSFCKCMGLYHDESPLFGEKFGSFNRIFGSKSKAYPLGRDPSRWRSKMASFFG